MRCSPLPEPEVKVREKGGGRRSGEVGGGSDACGGLWEGHECERSRAGGDAGLGVEGRARAGRGRDGRGKGRRAPASPLPSHFVAAKKDRLPAVPRAREAARARPACASLADRVARSGRLVCQRWRWRRELSPPRFGRANERASANARCADGPRAAGPLLGPRPLPLPSLLSLIRTRHHHRSCATWPARSWRPSPTSRPSPAR